MLVQGRRLENAARRQATLFISNLNLEHLKWILKSVLGASSSMTDYTIFSCFPGAIFFFKLGALASGLHLTKVQAEVHIRFKSQQLLQAFLNMHRNELTLNLTVSEGDSSLITYLKHYRQTRKVRR